jgi:tRNA(Arg) A34 adenosine deaminase TadA
MSNQGECPKCGKRVLHVRIENVVGTISDDSSGRCLSYSCIHCNAVLGVQIDPRAKSRPKRKPATA